MVQEVLLVLREFRECGEPQDLQGQAELQALTECVVPQAQPEPLELQVQRGPQGLQERRL